MKLQAIALLSAIYLMSGCMHTVYKFPVAANGKKIQDKDVTVLWFIRDPYDPAKHCSTLASYEHVQSFVDVLISSLTIGLYSPVSVTLVCGEGSKGAEKGEKAEKTEKNDKPAKPRKKK